MTDQTTPTCTLCGGDIDPDDKIAATAEVCTACLDSGVAQAVAEDAALERDDGSTSS